ncbi:MAG: response regulator [Myxococcales bacterium]
MKVLIADDDPVSRAILEGMVRRLGYEPVLAEGGRAALAAIAREEVPLLVTDWQMPDVDGIELCRRLRAPNRKVYTWVLVLTTLSGKKKYLEALEAGADDFMTKPVDVDELAARLKGGERIVALQKEMRQMEGLLSICMICKKIREGGEWVPVDKYVTDHTATSFSHAFCPECLARQMAE